MRARWRGGAREFEALVTAAHTDGTLDLQYTDGSGDSESHVPPRLVSQAEKDRTVRAGGLCREQAIETLTLNLRLRGGQGKKKRKCKAKNLWPCFIQSIPYFEPTHT